MCRCESFSRIWSIPSPHREYFIFSSLIAIVVFHPPRKVFNSGITEKDRIQGDISTKSGVLKIVEQIKAKEEKMDCLVNCAGVSSPWKNPISDHNDCTYLDRLGAYVREVADRVS